MNSLALNIALAAPTLTYASTATTGGTLAAATYFYRVSPIMDYGPGGPLPGVSGSTGQFEGLACAQGAGQITTGATSTVTITWTAVPGATGYKVYGRTTGAETLMATLGNVLTFTDTGAITPGSATPLATSTALGGNCFLPGANAGGIYPVKSDVAAVAASPFTAGRNVTIINMTAGSIVYKGSDDGVTYTTVATVPSLGCSDVTLQNFGVAASAGLYALGSA